MNKVITINLNGRAYQVEEEGYAKLQEYLGEAKERLKNDPDKDEIVIDLEQAIAEKLSRYLNQNKTVVALSEVLAVLNEMGPVQSSSGEENGQKETAGASRETGKHLYKIREGAMIRGVCAGLAAYFNVDVTLVRIIFAALTLITHGGGILIYILLAIFLPEAKTSEDMAAASGKPFTAQELVNRAREEYSKFSDKDERRKWKHELKTKFRQDRREWRRRRHENHSPHSILGLLIAALFLFWIYGLFTIIINRTVMGWPVPVAMPLLIVVIIWICIYCLVVWPIKSMRCAARYNDGIVPAHHHHIFFELFFWFVIMVFAIWATWHYIPASHIYLERVWSWWRQLSSSTH